MEGDDHARAIDAISAVNEHTAALRGSDDFHYALHVSVIRPAPIGNGMLK